MAKKAVLSSEELSKAVIKQDDRDDAKKLKDFIKENISSMLGSDGEPDLGRIKDILGLSSLNGYELKFPGKGLANALYSEPIYKELKNIDESKNNKINENFIIKGDNLDALKILAKGYTNKIKMIYIDPPYNTMNNDFIYNDNFRDDFKAIARISGLIDEAGNKSKNLEEMERIFKGTRTHSAWLCFMYPRLKLARDLLKDDGVIFISIDNNEQANLKLLCDEIFGEDNFIETFLWKKTETPPSASNKTRKTHEFILCYQKKIDDKKFVARFAEGGDAPLWNETNSERILEFPANYVNSTLPDGSYKKGVRDKIELLDDVKVKNSKIINSFRLKGHFRWKQETLNEEIENNVNLIVKSDKFSIRYCREDERIVMPTNEISKKDNVGTNETASKELLNLFDNQKIFSFNKPISLIQYLIKLPTNPNDNDIILDFFAGSGTTAHAVMAQNLADNGNRKFILVQLDESVDEKKSKTAFDFCKNELKSAEPNISDITIERVKRAKSALNSQMEFSVYEIEKEPDIDVQENLFGERQIINPLDLVTNMLLKSGNEIGAKNIECVIENRLYKVENDYFVLSLLEKDDKELFKVLDKDRNGNVYADIYINCDIEVWLNFQSKFKERLRIL